MIKYGIKSIDCYEKEYFSDIYDVPEVVEMALCENELIYKLEIREAFLSESTKYYGWFDFEKKTISMIYPDKMLFNMCFPYGYKAEETHNEGKMIKVIVEELEEIK